MSGLKGASDEKSHETGIQRAIRCMKVGEMSFLPDLKSRPIIC